MGTIWTFLHVGVQGFVLYPPLLERNNLVRHVTVFSSHVSCGRRVYSELKRALQILNKLRDCSHALILFSGWYFCFEWRCSWRTQKRFKFSMQQPKTVIFPLLYLKCLIQVDRGYSHGKKKGNAFKIALGPACVSLTFMNYSTVWTFFFTFTER